MNNRDLIKGQASTLSRVLISVSNTNMVQRRVPYFDGYIIELVKYLKFSIRYLHAQEVVIRVISQGITVKIHFLITNGKTRY